MRPDISKPSASQIVRGRSLTEQDTTSTQNVAVVDETFVHNFFKPGEDPIGAHFGLDVPQASSTYEIVGVVRDAKYRDLTNSGPPRAMFFVSLAQRVHYPVAIMQSIDDRTHFIEGAVLQLHGSMEGSKPRSATSLATSIPTSRSSIFKPSRTRLIPTSISSASSPR